MGVPMCCELSSSARQGPEQVGSKTSPRPLSARKQKKEKGEKETNPQEAPFSPSTGPDGGSRARSSSKDTAIDKDTPVGTVEQDDDKDCASPKHDVKTTPRSEKKNRKSFSQLSRVESKEEKDFAKELEISARLIAHLGVIAPKNVPTSASGSAAPKARGRSGSIVETFAQDVSDGPQLGFPIRFEACEALRAHYTKNGASKLMNDRIANQLLEEFLAAYSEKHKSAVSTVKVPTEGKTPKLIIVGDTHGQLQDVLYIFNTHGPPSASNVYLFNGDVADRGLNCCEIFFMIFAYFLADPNCILMNRGNHESEEMNALEADCGGGFRDEVMAKYDSKMYWKFVAVMKRLQLVTLINDKVFVVHGGLSSVPLTLDFIRSIQHTELTMPEPNSAIKQEQAWNDLLWSDPSDDDGNKPSSRGVGVYFGPDIVAKFLKSNELKLMIRSHQLPEEQRGFQKQAGSKCITIFSASNYCGDSGNQGAVLIFEPEKFPEYKINEYYAPTLDMLGKMMSKGNKDWAAAGKALREQEKKTIEDSWRKKELQTMMVSIVESKPDIWTHIIEKEQNTSMVDFDAWSAIMQDVLGGSWRWDVAWETWGLGDANKKVNLRDFLGRFTVVLSKEEYMSFKLKAITAVYEAIIHQHTDLASMLELFDKDGDGTVDMQEMKEAIGEMDLNLTGAQKDSLLHTLFKNAPEDKGVPNLKIKDFLSRFTIVYKRAATSLSTGGADMDQRLAQEAIGKIAQLIAGMPLEDLKRAPSPTNKAKKGRKDQKAKTKGKKGEVEIAPSKSEGSLNTGGAVAAKLEALFETLDADKSGAIDNKEFVEGIMALPGVSTLKLSNGEKLGPERMNAMAKVVDHSGDGQISILELLEAFVFEDAGGDDMGDSLAEHMLTVLFRHRQALRAGARCFDVQGSGSVPRDDFYKVLIALNRTLSGPDGRSIILDSQVCDLCDALSTDGVGIDKGTMQIVYEDFFNSFIVVDRENPSTGVRLGRRKSGTAPT